MKTNPINHQSIALTTLIGEGAEPENRFQKLWNEAERLKRENVELEATLDQLVLRIKNTVGPIEMEMGQAMRIQIDKLISFCSRNALPKWQMHVLDEWIMSSMESLQSMGLVDDELANSLAALQSKTLGFEVDASCDRSASEQLADHMESQLDEIDAYLSNDWTIDEFDNEQDFLDWCEEQFAQSETDHLDDSRSSSDNAQLGDVFNDDYVDTIQPQTVFKTLFHRVARALHPDKETDPKQREFKQALMTQLLEARRQHDLMRVFQLYQEHVDETAAFDVQELAELEKILCQYIELESKRQIQITTKSHLHDIAYTQFYSDDPNAVNRAIAKKVQETKDRKIEIEVFSDTVTSIKKLGPYLEDRFQQLRQYL